MRIAALVSIVVLLVAPWPGGAQVAPPQDVVDGGLGSKGSFAWDPPTTNVDGTACTDLAGFKVYAFLAADDPRTNPLATPMWVGETTNLTMSVISIWPTLAAAGVREGDRLRFMATAIDTAGNESGWSNSWEGWIDVTKPVPPGHLRGLVK